MGGGPCGMKASQGGGRGAIAQSREAQGGCAPLAPGLRALQSPGLRGAPCSFLGSVGVRADICCFLETEQQQRLGEWGCPGTAGACGRS